MATYRPFYVGFWDDPEIEPFNPEEKLVYAFLFTNHLCTESGIYSISEKNISERTGIKINKINDIIKSLQNTYHKITYDKSIIFVHGFMHRNYKGSPEKLELSILKDFENHRSLICWSKFIEIYSRHCISNKIKSMLNTLQSVTDTSMEVFNDNDNSNSNSNSGIEEEMKEGKKGEDVKNIPTPEYLKQAMAGFIENRKGLKKPLGDNARSLIIEKLGRLYPGDIERQIACLNQSTENGWQGVFEIKTGSDRQQRYGKQEVTRQEIIDQFKRVDLS